jgi:hypothetical protein
MAGTDLHNQRARLKAAAAAAEAARLRRQGLLLPPPRLDGSGSNKAPATTTLAGPWRPTGRGTRAADPFPERLQTGAAGDPEAELTFQPILFVTGAGRGQGFDGTAGSGSGGGADSFLARLAQSERLRECHARELRRRVAAERGAAVVLSSSSSGGNDGTGRPQSPTTNALLARDRRCVADFASARGWGLPCEALFGAGGASAADADRALNRAVLDHRAELGLGADGDSEGEGSGGEEEAKEEQKRQQPRQQPLTPLRALLRKRGAAKVASVAAAVRSRLFLERVEADLGGRAGRMAALRRRMSQEAATRHAAELARARGEGRWHGGGGGAGSVGGNGSSLLNRNAPAATPEERDFLLAGGYFLRLGWRAEDDEEEEEGQQEEAPESDGDGDEDGADKDDGSDGGGGFGRRHGSKKKKKKRPPPPPSPMTPARAEAILTDERVEALLRRAAALARATAKKKKEGGGGGRSAAAVVDWRAKPWSGDGLSALQAREMLRRRRAELRARQQQGRHKGEELRLEAGGEEGDDAEQGGEDGEGRGDGGDAAASALAAMATGEETPLDRAVRLLAAAAGRPGSVGPAELLAMGTAAAAAAAGGDGGGGGAGGSKKAASSTPKPKTTTTAPPARRRAVATYRALRAQEFVEHAEADLDARAARAAAEEEALKERLRGKTVAPKRLDAFFERLSSDAARRAAALEAGRAEAADREAAAMRAAAAAAKHMRPGTAPAR